MLFLLRENNVQAYVFHVECNAAWDLSHHLTVDFAVYVYVYVYVYFSTCIQT